MTTLKPKSTPQLYRDCLRLAQHVAGQSAKGSALRSIVRSEFRKHVEEKDPEKLHELKQAAERALSNYFLFEKVRSDAKFAKAAKASRAREEAERSELEAAEAYLATQGRSWEDVRPEEDQEREIQLNEDGTVKEHDTDDENPYKTDSDDDAPPTKDAATKA